MTDTPDPTTRATAAELKVGDRVTIEGTVISFLSGGKEVRVRLAVGDLLWSKCVVTATPDSLRVIEDAT